MLVIGKFPSIHKQPVFGAGFVFNMRLLRIVDFLHRLAAARALNALATVEGTLGVRTAVLTSGVPSRKAKKECPLMLSLKSKSNKRRLLIRCVESGKLRANVARA